MKKTKLALAIASVALASSQAHATNGMNMEGYGPIATAMGGAAQAYDNGLAGMMVNPSTIMMDRKDGSTFQIAVGKLGPMVNNKMSAMNIDQDSDGTAYFMPGLGYATKSGKLTYGVGIMGQGGMGTEYGFATSSSDTFFQGGSFSDANTPVSQSGRENRSELSVGRIIAPINYEVDDKLTIGGSIDLVWAGMDIMMDMSGAQFASLAGAGHVSGSMFTGLQGYIGGGQITDIDWARFDFSDGSDYTGQAKATGFGGKLGLTYKANDKLTIGASYHTKTNLSDMTGDATLSMAVDGDLGAGALTAEEIDVVGQISVKDFQWPATLGLGMAYQANDQWKFTADYKRINWSEVMDKFNMVFVADATQAGYAAGFAGASLDVTLPQNWDDQNILQLGTEYKYSKSLALRAGLNLSNNPIPNDMVNPLFPATVEKHITAGFGYSFSENSTIDFSLTHAPATEVTGNGSLNTGLNISHAQTNWQVMYTRNW